MPKRCRGSTSAQDIPPTTSTRCRYRPDLTASSGEHRRRALAQGAGEAAFPQAPTGHSLRSRNPCGRWEPARRSCGSGKWLMRSVDVRGKSAALDVSDAPQCPSGPVPTGSALLVAVLVRRLRGVCIGRRRSFVLRQRSERRRRRPGRHVQPTGEVILRAGVTPTSHSTVTVPRQSANGDPL